MDTPTYPTAVGRDLAARRRAAGVSMDEVARRIPTTRQALRRWETKPDLPYVKARKYLAALAAAVEEKAQIPEAVA